MKFYRNTERITEKEAIEWLGRKVFDFRVESAKEEFATVSYNTTSWDDGFGIGR